MKKLMTLATLVVLVLFSSCSKENKETAAEEVSGTYAGTFSLAVPGQDPIPARVSLSASGETLTLSLIDNPFTSMIDIQGGITVSNVSCSKAEEKYAIAGSATLRGEVPGSNSPFDIPVTLTGTGTPGSMNIVINVVVQGIGTISVTFTGARQ